MTLRALLRTHLADLLVRGIRDDRLTETYAALAAIARIPPHEIAEHYHHLPDCVELRIHLPTPDRAARLARVWTARMIWGTVRAEGCEIILIESPGNADVLARELAYRWPRGATFN